jgi:hypothetical protein
MTGIPIPFNAMRNAINDLMNYSINDAIRHLAIIHSSGTSNTSCA